MLMFHNTQTQISPCIVSKAQYALNLKDIQPENTKKCSFQYWKRVIDTLCILNHINDEIIKQLAVNRFNELINN